MSEPEQTPTSIFGQYLLPHVADVAAEGAAADEADLQSIAQLKYDTEYATKQQNARDDAAAMTEDITTKINYPNHVAGIYDKICFKNRIIPNIFLWGDGTYKDNGNTLFDMLNVNNEGGSLIFKTKIDEILTIVFNEPSAVKNDKMYSNFLEFIKKMNVNLVVKDKKAYCQIELHDTIGQYMRSESKGDRCNALTYFVNVIVKIVAYINSNSGSGKLGNGRIEDVTLNKLFNFPAKVENTGSGFRKSYKACNTGTSLSIGGSKSRRRHRRKPARKTRRGRIHKSKAKAKTHRRRRHSRVRKHKKYTSHRRGKY